MDYTGTDKFRHYNLDVITFPGVGEFDIPQIKPEQYEPTDFIGFNFAKTCNDRTKGVHFYLDDYQFERVWGYLKRYTAMLSNFKAVLTPCFSIYTDWPKAVQVWNLYRRNFVGAYWQMHGMKVYPTVLWGDESTFDWCFEGQPTHSCVSIESVGTQRHAETRALFMKGYDAMLEHLQPETILFYGKVPDGCRGNIVPIEPFYANIARRKSAL